MTAWPLVNPSPLVGHEGIARASHARDWIAAATREPVAGSGPPDGTAHAGKRHRISRAVSGTPSHLRQADSHLCRRSPIVRADVRVKVRDQVHDFKGPCGLCGCFPTRSCARPRARTITRREDAHARSIMPAHPAHPAHPAPRLRFRRVTCPHLRPHVPHARAYLLPLRFFEVVSGSWWTLTPAAGDLQ